MPNFFELYSRYAEKTEPPPNFHAWSAIAAISALLGKKCQVSQGHYTVFPHLYIVLVGDPGTRKTTAAKMARRLVQLIDKVPIAPESASREALIDFMAVSKVLANDGRQDCSYWQASSFGAELDQFLGGKHINQAMVGFLTAIWDEPIFVEQTRKTGQVIVHNPYFTLLGCCTPNWVTDKLKSDVITDGFSRRVIFQLESERACLNPRPQNTPEKLEALDLLGYEVERIFAMQGQFEMSKKACELYDKFYYENADEAKKYSQKIQSYFTSKHDLLYKIAMCLSAGLNSHKKITSDIIMVANEFLKQSERNLETVFAGIGRNELKALGEAALAKMRLAGPRGITKAQFIMDNYESMNKAELEEIWEFLGSTGQTTPVIQGSAQDAPRCRATLLNPLPPPVNLLALTRHLVWRQEEKMEETGAFVIASRLDPKTVQHLDSLAERKRLSDSGILLRGKQSQVNDESSQSSERAAELPSPQTPQAGE